MEQLERQRETEEKERETENVGERERMYRPNLAKVHYVRSWELDG